MDAKIVLPNIKYPQPVLHPRLEIRRACKKQGRWWIITLNGREVYREARAKDARRFKREVYKWAGCGLQPLYNSEYVGEGNFPADKIPFWMAAEPLETQ